MTINLVQFPTPLGHMYSCSTSNGICLLEFFDRDSSEADCNELGKRLRGDIVTGNNQHLDKLQIEIAEYFQGKRQQFSIPLDISGTEFQQSVWGILLNIPYGETRSYKQQALKLGNLDAIRAVASANGSNPISIIIPCHRVIGSNGSLTGYGGGLHRKKWLLDFEKANSGGSVQQELKF